MSKIALESNAAGTGTFSIASPATNTNRTLTLPDETGTVLTSVSAIPAANLTGGVAASLLTGDVAAAQITGALNASGSAPIYACRAWVSFVGTGTIYILASGNVSSLTDLGVGQYQINFTTAMQDNSYAINVSAGVVGGGFGAFAVFDVATTYMSFYQNRVDAATGRQDGTLEYVSIFR